MKDRDFLMWIHERLEHVHKEDPCIDYMRKLRSIIELYDPHKVSPNITMSNNLDQLKEKLNVQA